MIHASSSKTRKKNPKSPSGLIKKKPLPSSLGIVLLDFFIAFLFIGRFAAPRGAVKKKKGT
jgi:hypothetical protein